MSGENRTIRLGGKVYPVDQVDSLTLTPTREDLLELLALNTANRRLDPNHITKFEKIMVRGEWIYDGFAVVINCRGELVDGQHRLTAMLRSGVFGKITISLGAHWNAFQTAGNQKPKTWNDVAQLAGIVSTKAVKAVFEIVNGGQVDRGIGRSSSTEIIEWHSRNLAVHESINFAQTLVKTNLCQPSLIAALHYICARHEEGFEARMFLNYIITEDTNERPADAAKLLRGRLIQNAVSKAKLPRREIWALLVKAYNHKDEPVKSLRWGSGGREAMPQLRFTSKCGAEGCLFCSVKEKEVA